MSEQGMSYAQCVASEIRAEAARQRTSGRVLAQHIRRPVTTVSRWLNGATPISLDDLHLLCDSLGVSTAVISQRAQDAFDGVQITRLTSGRTGGDQVTSVTKRYRIDATRDVNRVSKQNVIRRSERTSSARRPTLGGLVHVRTNLCSKIAA